MRRSPWRLSGPSHATPAAAYSNNVSRNDYQDLTRDLVGLPSISHRRQSLPGVDVLLGGGWGEITEDDREKQGQNYVAGNKYLAEADMKRIDVDNGGDYVVAQRTARQRGRDVLLSAARKAYAGRWRGLPGAYGITGSANPGCPGDDHGRLDLRRRRLRPDEPGRRCSVRP